MNLRGELPSANSPITKYRIFNKFFVKTRRVGRRQSPFFPPKLLSAEYNEYNGWECVIFCLLD